MLHKSDVSGHLTKWAINLIKYDVNFIPIVMIKEQAIEDFIEELAQVDTSATWIIEVDGSSCNAGPRVGIKIITRDQRTYENSIQL